MTTITKRALKIMILPPMLVGPKIMNCSPVVETTELDDSITEYSEINTECLTIIL